jgi:hypothetical protein
MPSPHDDPASAVQKRLDALTAEVERSKHDDRVASRVGCAVVIAVIAAPILLVLGLIALFALR